MHITQAARKLRPGTAWNYSDDILTQAEDGSPRVSVPTIDECKVLCEADAYRDKRALEYPPISDQLDALWKGGKAQADILSRVMAVKAKYPKPS